MINYSCLIVDDSETDVRVLQQQLNKLPILKQIDVCGSLDDIFPYLTTHSYDLLFLDMQLPGQSGLNWLRNSPHRPPVIVTTNFPEFAVDCFEFNVADYLVKPFSTDRLFRAINRGLVGRRSEPVGIDSRSIFLNVGRKLQKFNFEDIAYVESYGVYAKIHTNTDVSLVNESTSSLEERLPSRQFMRIHKSFIINLAKLTTIENRFVWLNDIKLPTGQNYRNLLGHLLQGKPKKPDDRDDIPES